MCPMIAGHLQGNMFRFSKLFYFQNPWVRRTWHCISLGEALRSVFTRHGEHHTVCFAEWLNITTAAGYTGALIFSPTMTRSTHEVSCCAVVLCDYFFTSGSLSVCNRQSIETLTKPNQSHCPWRLSLVRLQLIYCPVSLRGCYAWHKQHCFILTGCIKICEERNFCLGFLVAFINTEGDISPSRLMKFANVFNA